VLRESKAVMRLLLVWAATAVCLGIVLYFSRAEAKVETLGLHPPIIVELFTSEGCSSCPPADRLLLELQKQSKPDAQIIVLSEHVDYWDSLGWKDPFSSRQFSDRQSLYAHQQFTDDVYTPQMFVDGHKGFTGSDVSKVVEELKAAAKEHKTEVRIVELDSGVSSTKLRISVGAGKGADLMLAITEDGLETKVARGENRGRFLAHTGVVRLLKKLGTSDGKESSFEEIIGFDPAWRREKLRAVAFLQRPSGLIIGVGSLDLH
jgi:hypothetical protein